MITSDEFFTALGRVPVPYWIGHALVALGLYAATYVITGNNLAGALAGAMFYVGREIRDLEKLGYFDAPGFFSPVIVCTAAYLLTKVL